MNINYTNENKKLEQLKEIAISQAKAKMIEAQAKAIESDTRNKHKEKWLRY